MEAEGGARRLGSLTVYPVGLGTAPVSIEGRPDWDTGVRVVVAAVEAGMTLIDTADAYCLSSAREHGYGERLVAEALDRLGSAARDVVVATKGGEMRDRGAWRLIGSPENLRSACEASLRALGVDAIDLYQLHRPDPAVPLEESLGAMVQLREDGLVRELGVCNVTEDELAVAMGVAPLISVQNPLQFDSSTQDRIIETCERSGLSFLAHSPFGGPGRARRLADDSRLAGPAATMGAAPHDVALAALLSRSPAVIPIPGTASPRRPAHHASAAGIRLTPEMQRSIGLLRS